MGLLEAANREIAYIELPRKGLYRAFYMGLMEKSHIGPSI